MSDLELSMTTEPTNREKSFPTDWLWRAVLPIALVALLLGFAAVDRSVLSPANLLNIAQQTSDPLLLVFNIGAAVHRRV